MDIVVSSTGFDEAAKQLDPKRVTEGLILFFKRATAYVRDELRGRAPGRLSGKVRVKQDGMIPPKWAVIKVQSPLAHLIEGGTGPLGGGSFKHAAKHRPPTEAIMKSMGLPKAQAFVVARSIGLRGGNPPRPFIRPTFEATKTTVERLADEAMTEVLK